MSSFVISIVVLSIPALGLALFRTTWWWPMLLYVMGMLLGQGMGWLQLSDWVHLFHDTGLFMDGLPVVVWLIWSICAGASFDTTNVSTRDALPLGLAVGSVGTGLTILENSDHADRSVKMLAMRTTALLYPGSMIGGLYFFAESSMWYGLWIPAVVYMVLLRQRTSSSVNSQRLSLRWMLFGILTLMLSFVMHEWSVAVLMLTLPVWVWKCRSRLPWKHLLYVLGAFSCVNLAVAGGLPEIAAWGLEELPMDVHFALPGVLLVSVCLLSTAIGAIPMAFFGVALFERLVDLPSIGLSSGPLLGVYGIGLVLGNIRLFIWSRTVSSNIVSVIVASLLTCIVLAVWL